MLGEQTPDAPLSGWAAAHANIIKASSASFVQYSFPPCNHWGSHITMTEICIDPGGDVILLLENEANIDIIVFANRLPSLDFPTHITEVEDNVENNIIEQPPDTTRRIRVRVSSKHLSLASDKFKALLKPGFLTGDAFQRDGYVEIEMPDHAPALMILLYIVHGKTRKIPRSPDLEMLAQIAKLVLLLSARGC